MPSPIGHALGGALVAVVLAPPGRTGDPPRAWSAPASMALVRLAVAAGCVPDLDFLWGRHNMETHSLGAAVLAGVVTWWAYGRSSRAGLVVALAWASHVLFDWLGSDDTPPLGVMALWPFTSQFYFADAFVFEAISRRYWLDGFVAHNLRAVGSEIVMLAPLLGLAAWWRTRIRTVAGG